MFRAFFRPSSGAQWLQWQPLVLPSYRGDSRAVLAVGPAGNSSVLRQHTVNRHIFCVLYRSGGPGSSVGIATGYGLDGPEIESRWGARFSAPVQTGPGSHPASCTMGTGSFSVVKSGQCVMLTPHFLLVPWSWNSRAIPLLPRMGRTTCTEPQCLYKGDLYLYLFFRGQWSLLSCHSTALLT
jgi:hypothetical protein